MSAQMPQQIREELELIQRFASAYSHRFERLIEQLNAAASAATVGQTLRLCVEAVNMLLVAQSQIAAALHTMAQPAAKAA